IATGRVALRNGQLFASTPDGSTRAQTNLINTQFGIANGYLQQFAAIDTTGYSQVPGFTPAPAELTGPIPGTSPAPAELTGPIPGPSRGRAEWTGPIPGPSPAPAELTGPIPGTSQAPADLTGQFITASLAGFGAAALGAALAGETSPPAAPPAAAPA